MDRFGFGVFFLSLNTKGRDSQFICMVFFLFSGFAIIVSLFHVIRVYFSLFQTSPYIMFVLSDLCMNLTHDCRLKQSTYKILRFTIMDKTTYDWIFPLTAPGVGIEPDKSQQT